MNTHTKRKLITVDDVMQTPIDGSLKLPPGAILTPQAQDLASERRIVIRAADPEPTPPPRAAGFSPEPLGEPVLTPSPARSVPDDEPGNAVVSVVGRNRTRILAEITSAIAEVGGDVHDISQTILDDYFSLVMIVDLRAAGGTFGQFKRLLEGLSKPGDYKVTVQHEKLFRYMHRI